MEPTAVAIAFVITAVAATVQGTVGVGFAMMAVPLTSLVSPQLAPVPQLLIIVPMTIAMAWGERTSIDFSGVGWILIGRFPGAALGLALLAIATQQVLDLFIGIVVLLAVAIIGSGFHVARTAGTKFGAGVAAGTTGLVASMGGPPIALIYSSEEAATIRATLAAVFTFGVTISIIVRFASGNIADTDIRASLLLFPAVVLGYVASLLLKERVSRPVVRTSLLTVSAVAGVALIGRALLG